MLMFLSARILSSAEPAGVSRDSACKFFTVSWKKTIYNGSNMNCQTCLVFLINRLDDCTGFGFSTSVGPILATQSVMCVIDTLQHNGRFQWDMIPHRSIRPLFDGSNHDPTFPPNYSFFIETQHAISKTTFLLIHLLNFGQIARLSLSS